MELVIDSRIHAIRLNRGFTRLNLAANDKVNRDTSFKELHTCDR